MRKFKFFLLTSMALLLSLSTTFGQNLVGAVELTKIQKMSVDEIFTELNNLREDGATIEEGKKFLESHGINVEKISTMYFDIETGQSVDPDQFSIQHVDPGVVTVTNWIDSNRNGSEYYIYAELERSSDSENNPGDYDILSLNWDDSKFDYMDWGTIDSDRIWLNDARESSRGTVIFNVKDNWYKSGSDYIAGWVTVRDIGSGYADTNIRFTHSYNALSTNHSANIDFSFPKAVGVGYSIDWTTSQNEWSKADTSEIYLY